MGVRMMPGVCVNSDLCVRNSVQNGPCCSAVQFYSFYTVCYVRECECACRAVCCSMLGCKSSDPPSRYTQNITVKNGKKREQRQAAGRLGGTCNHSEMLLCCLTGLRGELQSCCLNKASTYITKNIRFCPVLHYFSA